jgi:hypothetical protein
LLIWGLLGLLKAHKGHVETPDQYFPVCKYSPRCYLPIPSYLRLKPLRFNGYNKMYPVVAYFEANFGTFWSFEGACGGSGDPRPIFFTFYV